MTPSKRPVACAILFALALSACNPDGGARQPANNTNGAGAAASPASNANGGGAAEAAAGVEKRKPAPGTGNVQGKVLYNGKPVADIEVKLCEKFSRFFGGCGGKTYTARSDGDGDYVIADVPPMTYEGLLARAFDEDSWVFATTGIGGLSASKYEVAADKTLFVNPTNLFKSDLKTVSPKAGAKVSGQGLELKWDAYPDASYYRFSLYATESGATSPYINERVDGTSFTLEKPMPKGTYRWEIQAFNDGNRKLAQNGDDIKFTITDGPEPGQK